MVGQVVKEITFDPKSSRTFFSLYYLSAGFGCIFNNLSYLHLKPELLSYCQNLMPLFYFLYD